MVDQTNNPFDEEELESLEDLQSTGNDTIDEAASPETLGEQSMSGTDPDPESDDNALDAAQEAAVAPDADEEHPQPMNIAEDVRKAQRDS